MTEPKKQCSFDSDASDSEVFSESSSAASQYDDQSEPEDQQTSLPPLEQKSTSGLPPSLRLSLDGDQPGLVPRLGMGRLSTGAPEVNGLATARGAPSDRRLPLHGTENTLSRGPPKLKLPPMKSDLSTLQQQRQPQTPRSGSFGTAVHLDLLADGFEFSADRLAGLAKDAGNCPHRAANCLKQEAAELFGLNASNITLFELREVQDGHPVSRGCTKFAVCIPKGGFSVNAVEEQLRTAEALTAENQRLATTAEQDRLAIAALKLELHQQTELLSQARKQEAERWAEALASENQRLEATAEQDRLAISTLRQEILEQAELLRQARMHESKLMETISELRKGGGRSKTANRKGKSGSAVTSSSSPEEGYHTWLTANYRPRASPDDATAALRQENSQLQAQLQELRGKLARSCLLNEEAKDALGDMRREVVNLTSHADSLSHSLASGHSSPMSSTSNESQVGGRPPPAAGPSAAPHPDWHARFLHCILRMCSEDRVQQLEKILGVLERVER